MAKKERIQREVKIKVSEAVQDNDAVIKITLPKGFEKKHLIMRTAGRLVILNGERNTKVKRTGEKRTNLFNYKVNLSGFDMSTLSAKLNDNTLEILANKEAETEKAIPIE